MIPAGGVEHLRHDLGVRVRLRAGRPLPELTRDLDRACDVMEDRRSTAVLVLHVERTPLDRRSWPGHATVSDVSRWERALHRVDRLDSLSIAVLDGMVGGPAFDVLLTADFRIGTPGLVLLAPVNEGHFWPGMSVYRLVQQVGLARARQWVLWGDDVLAARALEWGLVDQIVDDTASAVDSAAVMMGRISDSDLRVRRHLLAEAVHATYEEALGAHLAACARELDRLERVLPSVSTSDRTPEGEPGTTSGEEGEDRDGLAPHRG